MSMLPRLTLVTVTWEQAGEKKSQRFPVDESHLKSLKQRIQAGETVKLREVTVVNSPDLDAEAPITGIV